ncbi:MAG: hypothetical protein AUJ20_14325 [Comamonadaceae bacterium CG1_02_60_18]|nr:MAG: hypothetical protein AUJ20_14325 [Comamonadaceae bacterium CG1_02_60_18]PIQ50741.1 MAG: hypothetical protein COW02_19230 [Comamonadaceae bacterium CG12_big_fil_rev_8_21_14_0_65_59_15]
MFKVLVGVYIAAVLMLAWAAVNIGRLRCEGFGCTAIGVAWIAWAAVFVVVLVVGLIARNKTTSVAGFGPAAKIALWVQLVTGVCALAAWVYAGAT